MGAHKEYFVDLTGGEGHKPLIERVRAGGQVTLRYRVTVGEARTYVKARSHYEAASAALEAISLPEETTDIDVDVDLLDWWRVPVTAKESAYDDGRPNSWDALVQAESADEALSEAMAAHPGATYGAPAHLGQL